MPTVTVGDLLDRGREFEARLEAYYAKIRDRSQDNEVRLLTYYLARHCRHQDQVMATYDKTQVANLRKAEVTHDVVFESEKHFPLLGRRPEGVTGEELLQAALKYDQTLIVLYRSILEQPIDDELRVMVESLIRVEERDIVMMKKMIAMHYF